MSGIGDVAAQIREVIAELGEARAKVDGALEAFERPGQSFAGTGRGSGRYDLPAAVDACAEAAESSVRSIGEVDAAREKLWDYLVTVAPTLAGPRPSGGGHAVRPPPAGEPPVPAPLPRHVRAGAARLPHRRPDDESFARGERVQATHGIVTNDDHNDLQIGDMIRSGLGLGSMARGLDRAYRWGNNLDHVESHAAALMRNDPGLRNVTLVINNVPCNPDQPMRDAKTGAVKHNRDGTVLYKRYTCDEQLPAMMPEGATMTVYVREHGQGLRYFKTYTGTGEGLAR